MAPDPLSLLPRAKGSFRSGLPASRTRSPLRHPP
jgi:hypothetical protein